MKVLKPIVLKPLYLILLVCCIPALSYANSIVVAVGSEGIVPEDKNSAMFGIEWKGGTLHRKGNVITRFSFAGRIEEDGDKYIAGGFVTEWNFTQRQFFELSLMPGYYNADEDGTQLGGDFHFRSLFGYGFRLSKSTSISIAVDHLSNSSFYDSNPGTEALAIRLEQTF